MTAPQVIHFIEWLDDDHTVFGSTIGILDYQTFIGNGIIGTAQGHFKIANIDDMEIPT